MIKIGKTYRLYGRIGVMKRMKPVCKDHFVTNLLHADLYTPQTDADCANMAHELNYLAAQGTFEYRPVNQER